VKIFETFDGRKLQIRNDKAILWKPDSCQCHLIIEIGTNLLIFAIRVCHIHKTVNDNALVRIVLIHNNSFNEKFGNRVLTLIERNEISQDKRIESIRILSLGDPETR